MSAFDEFFEGRYTPEPNTGCYLWTMSLYAHGYGQTRYHTTPWYAHRLSYFLSTGVHPGRLCVCHKCDTPACVNPQHLFLGTNADNVQDKIRKGRDKYAHGETHYAKTKNHLMARGSRHGRSKLTADQVVQIRALNGQMSQQALGERFGISQTHVGRILRGTKWAHIK